MSKTSHLHWRHRFSTSISESFKTKLCHSTSHAISWVLRVPLDAKECFIFVLARTKLFKLPSVVFLGVITSFPLDFSPPNNKNFENVCLLICTTSISPVFINSAFCQMTLLLIHWMLLDCPHLLEIIYPTSQNSNATCEIQAGCLSSAIFLTIFFTI